MLDQDRFALRKLFRDAGERRRSRLRRLEALSREWAALLKDPRPFALDVLEGHDIADDGTCECGRGRRYREHVLTILNDEGMLRIPPRMQGEGW